MSRFFSSRHASLTAYTPGEQPQDRRYVKLNTNESPFPPSPAVVAAAAAEAARLQLYSDPESRAVTEAVAARYGVSPNMVLMVNGSDEILNFAFLAFGDAEHGFVCPDISYGFYPVFAALNHVPLREIPLRDDFSVDPEDYGGVGKTVFIANPNAPTGIALSPAEIRPILRSNPDCVVGANIVLANPNAPTGRALPLADIERIVQTNPGHVVVIDEAYVDFGGESCAALVKRYDNLLVTQTFSKSRSLAGGRLGFGIGCPALIRDLNTIKYSTNPYNVNRMSAACGAAAIADDAYYRKNARTIMENRAYTAQALRQRGFEVLPSAANFLFARPAFCGGGELYRGLKARGVLIRHWDKPRIEAWCRITVGTKEQMDALLAAIDDMIREANA